MEDSNIQHWLITRVSCVQRCWLRQEYLMAHMQMMGEENARLMAEVARLEAKVEAAGAEAERRGRTAAQQLDRERAKNKVLVSRLRGGGGGGAEDVILVAGEHSSRARSASVGARAASRPASGASSEVSEAEAISSKRNKIYR